MELRNNDKVFFEPISHTYLIGDKVLIGVTSLMEKHGLSPDYSGIPKATLMKAAEEGTAIHKEIEDYDNGISVLRTPLIEEYIAICQENGLIFAQNEFLVSDDELVASSIDGVYGPENTISLVDYKTTQKVHRRPLAWQLGIYKVLFERQTGLKVANCYCLHIDKKERTIKGLIPIEPVSESEVDALLQAEREGRIYIDLHEEPSAELVLTDAELTAYVTQQNEIARLKEQIKGIEETIKGLDARVLAYMTENNLETLEGGGGVFKVKKAYERASIDTARLKKMQPGIYEQYKKVTNVAASLSFTQNK
jgi:CRISPR/Cas system-associated exonuclease Cas4 (RecB family)